METKQKETIYFPCCPYGLFRCTSYQGAFTPCSVRRRATCKLVSLQRARSGSTEMVLGTEKQTACSRDQPLLGVSRELATSKPCTRETKCREHAEAAYGNHELTALLGNLPCSSPLQRNGFEQLQLVSHEL